METEGRSPLWLLQRSLALGWESQVGTGQLWSTLKLLTVHSARWLCEACVVIVFIEHLPGRATVVVGEALFLVQ